MTTTIDLNCDLGEGFGAYTLGDDAALMRIVSSANVACGFHAGDPRTMRRGVAAAHAAGVAVGAHPGYPDRVGFGRRDLGATAEEITTDVLYQIGALAAFCAAEGLPLQHVKPHGALYNLAARDRRVADAVVVAIASFDPTLILFAPSGSAMAEAASAHNLRIAREIFADRAVEPDGRLVARSTPGAVIMESDAVIARTLRMIRTGRVTAINGEEIAMTGETICIHGDTPDAVGLLGRLRAALEAEGIGVRPVGEWIGR